MVRSFLCEQTSRSEGLSEMGTIGGFNDFNKGSKDNTFRTLEPIAPMFSAFYSSLNRNRDIEKENRAVPLRPSLPCKGQAHTSQGEKRSGYSPAGQLGTINSANWPQGIYIRNGQADNTQAQGGRGVVLITPYDISACGNSIDLTPYRRAGILPPITTGAGS